MPLVIAYHLIWTAYGSWLPNDPRGSMSRCIRNDIFAELGTLHLGRKHVQPASSIIRAFYEQAKPLLKHDSLIFGAKEVAQIAVAFGTEIAARCYTCYACAIMPDHVHLLIRKHKDSAEEMIQNLQRESHLHLRNVRLRDLTHPVWGGPGWKVFLDHPNDVRRTIAYIIENPIKAQKWDFVKEYDGWPLHPGHSPNSPYARRMGPG